MDGPKKKRGLHVLIGLGGDGMSKASKEESSSEEGSSEHEEIARQILDAIKDDDEVAFAHGIKAMFEACKDEEY